MIDALSEPLDKKRSEIIEELDLETDEQQGLKLTVENRKYIITESV